jgi:NADH dehydrogenase (ubiquinone) 1 alpha subcomplex subunit 13
VLYFFASEVLLHMSTPVRKFQEPVHIVRGQFFPDIPFRDRPVPRGIPGIFIWAVGGATIFFGHLVHFYAMQARLYVTQVNLHQPFSAEKEKVHQVRRTIIPMLQAEEDVKYLQARKVQIEEEEKYASNIPGWVVGGSTYNTRWMPPAQDPVGNWY